MYIPISVSSHNHFVQTLCGVQVVATVRASYAGRYFMVSLLEQCSYSCKPASEANNQYIRVWIQGLKDTWQRAIRL